MNCACWISGSLPARSEFLDAAERLVSLSSDFSCSVFHERRIGDTHAQFDIGLIFFIGRTLLNLDSDGFSLP